MSRRSEAKAKRRAARRAKAPTVDVYRAGPLPTPAARPHPAEPMPTFCRGDLVGHRDGAELCTLGADCLAARQDLDAVVAAHGYGGSECGGVEDGCEHCLAVFEECAEPLTEVDDGVVCAAGHDELDDVEEGRWHSASLPAVDEDLGGDEDDGEDLEVAPLPPLQEHR